MTTEEKSFLAAIFAEPKEDSHRLVLADYLQENEQEERAEFIRVQVEMVKPLQRKVFDQEEYKRLTANLSKLERGDPTLKHRLMLPLQLAWGKAVDERERVTNRAKSLLTPARARDWFPGPWWDDNPPWDTMRNFRVEVPSRSSFGWQNFPARIRYLFERGFVSEVELSLENFSSYAPHLFEHPVESVTLFDAGIRLEIDPPDGQGSGWQVYVYRTEDHPDSDYVGFTSWESREDMVRGVRSFAEIQAPR
jgi:uncharacterized protein (TIGR02996 family)